MAALPRSEIDHVPAPQLDNLNITGNLDGVLTVTMSAGGLTLVATGNRRQLFEAAEQIYGAFKKMEPGK